jgi:hypothetical protein
MTLRVFYIFSEFKPRLLSVRSDEDAERCVKLNFSVTLPEVNSMYLRGMVLGHHPVRYARKRLTLVQATVTRRADYLLDEQHEIFQYGQVLCNNTINMTDR